jgi:hypothetical protein
MVASRNISQGNFCGLCWYFCLGKPQILQPGSTQFPAADMVKSSMQDEKFLHGLGLLFPLKEQALFHCFSHL